MANPPPISVTEYDAKGHVIATSQIHGPECLDWMSIDVKADWFTWLGRGNSETKSVLLKSQGEQKLLTSMTLKPLDHREYKEKMNGSDEIVQRLIDEGGYSRVPRNQ